MDFIVRRANLPFRPTIGQLTLTIKVRIPLLLISTRLLHMIVIHAKINDHASFVFLYPIPFFQPFLIRKYQASLAFDYFIIIGIINCNITKKQQ